MTMPIKFVSHKEILINYAQEHYIGYVAVFEITELLELFYMNTRPDPSVQSFIKEYIMNYETSICNSTEEYIFIELDMKDVKIACDLNCIMNVYVFDITKDSINCLAGD